MHSFLSVAVPSGRTQTGQIEARRDITGGRSVWDSRTALNSTANKAFTSLCYTADGQCLLAGGASKFVCIYDVRLRAGKGSE